MNNPRTKQALKSVKNCITKIDQITSSHFCLIHPCIFVVGKALKCSDEMSWTTFANAVKTGAKGV